MTIAVLRFKVYLCNELQDTLLIKSMIIKKTNEAISIGFPFTYFSFLQPVRRHYAGTRTKRVIPDSIRISLLTCASGEEIYSLFGHTAIRYENYTRGIDAVFNYGIFNFNAPNFILRFALGETDYQLGVTDYERFAAEYYYLERDVWQQELNLTVQEKEKLVMLLEENYRPENRIYRYNFFYDNCATRPRDLIENPLTARCNTQMT